MKNVKEMYWESNNKVLRKICDRKEPEKGKKYIKFFYCIRILLGKNMGFIIIVQK